MDRWRLWVWWVMDGWRAADADIQVLQWWVCYTCTTAAQAAITDHGDATLSPVSTQTQSLALRKRKPQETQNHGCHCFDRAFLLAGACVCCVLGRSSGNHDWLFANASACVSCGFCLRNARNASDCVWMETGLYTLPAPLTLIHSCHRRNRSNSTITDTDQWRHLVFGWGGHTRQCMDSYLYGVAHSQLYYGCTE